MHVLNQVLGRLPIGVWVGAVPTGEVVYSNAAFRNILGLDPVQSSQIADVPETYRVFDLTGTPYPVEQLPFTQVVRTRQPVVVDDLVVRRPDGTQINLRAFGYPMLDNGHQLAHVSVSFVDITREVRAERERDTAAARLAFAVAHSPIVIWSADHEGTLTLLQGAPLASLGVVPGELVGKNLFALHEDHPTISGAIRRALAGESIQYVAEVGDAVFDTWLTPIFDAAGKVRGVTGLSRDIREVRKLQALGIQNDRTRTLGTLAASVAHEINNPLTYMLSHAQQIDADLQNLTELSRAFIPQTLDQVADLLVTLSDDFQVVKQGIDRIVSITRELRTFSHFDDRIVAVDARAAVHSVLQLVGKELEARARISLDLSETAPIAGHAGRLVQVILNLVTNAMQALASTERSASIVEIATYTRDGHVFIEVADSGPGVPALDRERIFEPFVTTKVVGEGTGLGLFVCRNIVRGYSGDVNVYDRKGGGALFRVTLPISEAPASTPSSVSEKRVQSGSQLAHVLVIDDDPHVLAALVGTLERARYRVTACSSAEAGLERLRAHAELDLVFCDLMMKGMSGMDLYARLVEQAPAALPKLVFMTGGAHSPAAASFLREHASRVLEKPFDLIRETDRRLRARPDPLA